MWFKLLERSLHYIIIIAMHIIDSECFMEHNFCLLYMISNFVSKDLINWSNTFSFTANYSIAKLK